VHPPSKPFLTPYPAGQLRPGAPTSPGRHHLGLLPPGPDPVRGCPPRGTQPSTLPDRADTPGMTPQGGVRPRYGGLRVQGTASSPPSTTRRYVNRRTSPLSKYRRSSSQDIVQQTIPGMRRANVGAPSNRPFRARLPEMCYNACDKPSEQLPLTRSRR